MLQQKPHKINDQNIFYDFACVCIMHAKHDRYLYLELITYYAPAPIGRRH